MNPDGMAHEPTGRVSILHFIVMAVIGWILVWLIATKTLTAYLATTAPETALRLDPGHSVALMTMADTMLNAKRAAGRPGDGSAPGEAVDDAQPGPSPATTDLAVALSRLAAENLLPPQQGQPATAGSPPPAAGETKSARPPLSEADAARVRLLVTRALVRDPTNARAIRILGQLALSKADDAETDRLMRAAGRRSLRESVAVLWMLQKSFERGEYADTLSHADALLRSRPNTASYVAPVMARLAEDKNTRPQLIELLASDPPWRSNLFSEMLRYIRDGSTPLDLLLGLKKSPHPPTTNELQIYLNFLLSHKLYDLAYYAWLQFLTPDQLARCGMLYNGGFEDQPSGLPFDWTLRHGFGFTADRISRPDKDGEHALAIEFGQGRVEFQPIAQTTLLAPGTYRLVGKHKGQISARRGLIWRVQCLGGATIAESPLGIAIMPTWKSFEMTFTVPAANCRAQQVRLEHDARSASEQFISGGIWFDDLLVSRIDATGSAAKPVTAPKPPGDAPAAGGAASTADGAGSAAGAGGGNASTSGTTGAGGAAVPATAAPSPATAGPGNTDNPKAAP